MGIFNFFSKKKPKHKYIFKLPTKKGDIEYYNPFINFLVYGGAGSGKTKSIGKPLLKEYIRNQFAGLVYDYKDMDFTQSIYNMLMSEDNNYSYPFYIINFADARYSARTNPISPKYLDERVFLQMIEDMYMSYNGGGSGSSDQFWTIGAIGILQGVAYRFYEDYPQFCTIPHIVLFLTLYDKKQLTTFLEGNSRSRGLASAFLNAKGSDATQASLLSSLLANLSQLSFNKEALYILSGNDFDFNLIDPQNPKLVSVCSSFQIDSAISPIVALMIGISSRQFTMANQVPAFYLLDEATTFKIANFESLCSVLREYKCSFTFMTQSSSKIITRYGKQEKITIEANFGNHFYGRTLDKEAIRDYPSLFGLVYKKQYSSSIGGSGTRSNHSKTTSERKENRYDPEYFTGLKPGHFVGVCTESNKKRFDEQLGLYKEYPYVDIPMREENIKQACDEAYEKIVNDLKIII